MNSAQATYFDEVAASYHRRSESGLWNWFRSIETRALLSCIPRQPKNILEVGCGSGFYTRMLSRLQPHSLVAVDPSAAMLSQIDDRICTKVHCAIEEFHTEQPFDLIVAAGVLEFVTHPTEVLASLSQMLELGGRLILLVPARTLWGVLYSLYHRFHGIHPRLFSKREIQTEGTKNGLTLKHITSNLGFSLVVLFEKNTVHR